jgi:hypothetical protein
MQYYFVLAIATVIVVVLGLLLWLKTRNLAFPIGLGLIYYLSLFGGWFIVYDKSGGDSGKHYHYLEDKLFPVRLDDDYLTALILYAVFVILIGALTLVLVRRDPGRDAAPQKCLHISHWPIIVACSVAGVVSYLLVREGVNAATAAGVPAYALMGRGFGEVSAWFTVHQITLRLALVPSVIGLAVMLSGKGPRLLSGERSPLAIALYGLIVGSALSLAFLLGYKSEIFSAGLIGGLFYLTNSRNRHVFPAALAGAAVIVGMWLVDKLRYTSLDQFDAELLIGTISDIGDMFNFLTSSNEAFAGHFSMYGVLSQHVPLTYGSSLISLAASAVPRLLWVHRPADIYSYYADAVMAEPGQGYTINHATAWFLNFGVPGILLGALLFAWVWASSFNLCAYASSIRNRYLRITACIAPFTITAYIAPLIRSGPEAYKGLLVEAILLPSLILTFSLLKPYWARKERVAATP